MVRRARGSAARVAVRDRPTNADARRAALEVSRDPGLLEPCAPRARPVNGQGLDGPVSPERVGMDVTL